MDSPRRSPASFIVDLALRPARWTAITVGLVSVLALSLVDSYAGEAFNFSIFYLAPVLYVTWFGGRWFGALLALAAALAWGVADVSAGAKDSSLLIPAWNTATRFGFSWMTLWLLDRLHAANDLAVAQAGTDALTGLCNTRTFYAALEHEITLQRRYGHPFTLAYLDLDDFKSVNDTFGHARGDRLLSEIAAALRTAVRDSDVLARLGGDEFGILMRETDTDSATTALQRVLDTIDDAVRPVAARAPGIGATVGAVVYLSPPDSLDEAITAADRAMYAGKPEGRDPINVIIHGTRASEAAANA